MKHLSTTRAGEERRKAYSETIKQAHTTLRRVYGKIHKIDEGVKNKVVVVLGDGTLAGGGRFIPLTNAPLDIAARWGHVREGLLVEVVYAGEAETHAMATIIGSDEDENVDLLIDPEISVNGLYAIFI